MMVLVMVYAMICYNISLATGGLHNAVFLAAFHELVIMGPIARKSVFAQNRQQMPRIHQTVKHNVRQRFF